VPAAFCALGLVALALPPRVAFSSASSGAGVLAGQRLRARRLQEHDLPDGLSERMAMRASIECLSNGQVQHRGISASRSSSMDSGASVVSHVLGCAFAAAVMLGALPALADTGADSISSAVAEAAATPASASPAPAAAIPSPASSIGQTKERPTQSIPPEIAAKMRKQMQSVQEEVPVLSPEEVARRHTTPTKEVLMEEWYQRGKKAFVAKCAGCHPGGTNTVKVYKSLFLDDLERNGVLDQEKIRYIIRYGKGKMPGFAKDCTSESDYTQCGVITPLSDLTLRDVQDFVMNRANENWKGRG